MLALFAVCDTDSRLDSRHKLKHPLAPPSTHSQRPLAVRGRGLVASVSYMLVVVVVRVVRCLSLFCLVVFSFFALFFSLSLDVWVVVRCSCCFPLVASTARVSCEKSRVRLQMAARTIAIEYISTFVKCLFIIFVSSTTMYCYYVHGRDTCSTGTFLMEFKQRPYQPE